MPDWHIRVNDLHDVGIVYICGKLEFQHWASDPIKNIVIGLVQLHPVSR